MTERIRKIHFELPDGSCPCGKRWAVDLRFPGLVVLASRTAASVTCWPCYSAAMEAQREAERRRPAP